MPRLWIHAPFTLGGNCRATGWDSSNRLWSLVVAPSLRLSLMSGADRKPLCHGNKKIIFISATKWMVARLSGIVETQLRHSCVGVTQLICKKTHYGSMAERCECTTTMSQISPTLRRQMETVKVKWLVLETMGRQITWHYHNTSTNLPPLIVQSMVHLQLKGVLSLSWLT